MRKSPAGQIFILLLVPLALGIQAHGQKEEPWKEWLQEVDPIMTNAEKSVFHSLKTEEDRSRFVDSFWKARDRSPQTPQNEYKAEYYQRISTAKKSLGGIRSDRGKIYLILGEPTEKQTFIGSERLVDAELWTYYGEGRPGLPPVMNLIFFRRGNAGDFRLYFPGVDTAMDVISPAYLYSVDNAVVAYEELRKSNIELADATLSVIPGEGTPGAPATATLSSRVLAQIYALPEKESSPSYLRAFGSLEGSVDVTYSTREMPGFILTALSRSRGFTFFNYAVAPEAVHLSRLADNQYASSLHLNLKIESRGGKTIYQQERNVEFRLDPSEKKALDERKIMFSGFLPIIPGAFHIKIVLSNRTTQEFLIDEESFETDEKTVPVLHGYGIREHRSDRFLPFSTEKYQLSIDPRSVFNKTDSVQGIIFTDKEPSVRLSAAEEETDTLQVTDIRKEDGYYLFRQPLGEKKPGHYFLIVEVEGREVSKKVIAVLPQVVPRPEVYEWSDPAGSDSAYRFELATQNLNLGNITASLEGFKSLPEAFWDFRTKPIIARAYYQAKDYEKVVEVLEGKGVIKDYSVLFLLGNSALELKQLGKAAVYFELLRGYGDTVKVNQVLGAIYLSLGERDKAKTYFERAKNLENKPPADSRKDNREHSPNSR
jgi:GWxTD domain-containing protein